MHSPVELERGPAVPAPAVALRRAGIVGLGGYLPEPAVDSDTIAMRLGVVDGWIQKRTGIHSRRRAQPDARVADLACVAGRLALADADLDAGAIDAVLVATLEADEITPNAAPQVAHALGATGAAAMDIGAACTGFVSALTVGASLIETERADAVLVIGAEILSRHTNPDDRATAGIFGDGAGAIVLSAQDRGGLGRGMFGSDGSGASFITAPRSDGFIRMDGHETFKRAVATLTSNALETVAANELELGDIDLFVFHQANGRIISAVGEALGVDSERVLDAIANVGNTSAASVPLALCEARRRGLLHEGARILLGAVGAGFTWGAVVVEWGPA